MKSRDRVRLVWSVTAGVVATAVAILLLAAPAQARIAELEAEENTVEESSTPDTVSMLVDNYVPEQRAEDYADYPRAQVVRWLDGDTFVAMMLDSRTIEHVHLIGIDAPELYHTSKLDRDIARLGLPSWEIRHQAVASTRYMQRTAPAGTIVSLQYGDERRDHFGRVLAFVWLDHGTILNEQIVCDGFARTFLRYPFQNEYEERWTACEVDAMQDRKGLWTDPKGFAVPPR